MYFILCPQYLDLWSRSVTVVDDNYYFYFIFLFFATWFCLDIGYSFSFTTYCMITPSGSDYHTQNESKPLTFFFIFWLIMNRSLLRHRFAQIFIRKHFIAMDSTSKFQAVHDPDKKEFVIRLKGQFIR